MRRDVLLHLRVVADVQVSGGESKGGEVVTFFSISRLPRRRRYVGESEKLVRCLFGVAAARQPSVVFVDEVGAKVAAAYSPHGATAATAATTTDTARSTRS